MHHKSKGMRGERGGKEKEAFVEQSWSKEFFRFTTCLLKCSAIIGFFRLKDGCGLFIPKSQNLCRKKCFGGLCIRSSFLSLSLSLSGRPKEKEIRDAWVIEDRQRRLMYDSYERLERKKT